MIYYKIRRKSDPNVFVSGTPYYHSYNSKGRIFQSMGTLRTFLTNSINRRDQSDIGDWEIIELKMVVTNVKELHSIIKPENIVKLLKKQ